MNVTKEARAGEGVRVDGQELALINRLSRRELTAEEVYVCGVRLCDTEVDRDQECFSRETLEGLARLFVGKSGIFDHQWSARGQAARIYRTELVEEGAVRTRMGEPYCCLMGYAYMLRTEGNRELIAEIEGGIKKEVSVGCAVERTVCSICGRDMADREQCCHVKGQVYGGKLCCGILSGAADAYEWSFVAVPAQPRAGVVKGARREEAGLKGLLRGRPEGLRQLARLEREAELGRRYLEGLRREVARLAGMVELNMDAGVLRSMADKLNERELLELKRAYEERLAERYPPAAQLPRERERGGGGTDAAFRI